MQLKISASYLAILLVVMVLMNTYPLLVSQDLVFRSKCSSLLSSAAVLNAAVSGPVSYTHLTLPTTAIV